MPFEDRTNRLKTITGGLPLLAQYPLLHMVELNDGQLARVRGSAIHYLWSTLSAYYRDRAFIPRENILEAYPEWLLKLPNVTPNGLVLPKEPITLAYNALHRAIADLFAELHFPMHFSHAQFPLNIRLVEGMPRPDADQRARSATKLHCDLWAGDPTGEIIFMLPLLGDIEHVRVDYFEPKQMLESFLGRLADFKDGAAVADGATPYDNAWRRGALTLFDPFLLHRTIKPGKGLRLSLEFRCLAQERVASDGEPSRNPSWTPLPIEQWLDCGRGRLVVTEAPLAPFVENDRSNAGYEIVPGPAAKHSTDAAKPR